MSQPVKLTEKLPLLADLTTYPERGSPLIRWGQLIRTTPSAASLLEDASSAGRLVPLSSLARVRSGVVTRANAYFIVQELTFEKIPNRFRLTRRDFSSIAVIVDGKDTPHRIGRRHLLNIVKGPESLVGPKEIHDSDLRLVAVEESVDELTALRDNDTKAYLRRGETVEYSQSADKMKGGIPSQRTNIRNRKPYWYSLNLPEARTGRLVVPEHFDQRFIATALTGDIKDYVVIDTCYVVECVDPGHQLMVLAALNSLLSWYQIELRGRTQHGEGVLKVKIPDFNGVLVLDPSTLSPAEKKELDEAFEPLANRKTLVVTEELEQGDRARFDAVYLRLTGISKQAVEETRILIARELRESMAERRTRPDSVAEFKAQRAPKQKTSRVVDSFAARIISSITAYPDPRHSIPENSFTLPVAVKDFEGGITIGDGLFDSGVVFAGTEPIASTNSANEARFVRAVLTIDPQLRTVEVPTNDLDKILERWSVDVAAWWNEFSTSLSLHTEQIADTKIIDAIQNKALELAHLSELPQGLHSTTAIATQKKIRPKRRKKV